MKGLTTLLAMLLIFPATKTVVSATVSVKHARSPRVESCVVSLVWFYSLLIQWGLLRCMDLITMHCDVWALPARTAATFSLLCI